MDVSSESSAGLGRPVSPEGEAISPVGGGPPSEASSQEWDKLTDPGTHTPVS
jgi:mitochondrial import receptor subunit TOM20